MVAYSRLKFTIPYPPDRECETEKEEGLLAELQEKALKLSIHIPIGLSEDGKTFHDSDIHAFLKRILWLRDLGYRIPDSVIDRINKEITGG